MLSRSLSQDTVQIQADLLFRNTSDGVLLFDQHRRLVQINPAAAGMLRLVPDEIIYRSADSVFKNQRSLLDVICGSGSQSRKISLPGKRVALSIGEDQHDGGRVLLLQDVTEREELDSRREQLLHTISHDLHNPITAIVGFAELIMMHGALTPEQQKFATRVKQTSQKLQSLVRTLVDLAWVESGMAMQNTPIHLDTVINDVVSELAFEAHRKRITMTVSIQHPIPIVMGDSLRLKQAIYNILHNAIVYSNPESPVVIHALADGRQVRCKIADRGIGIAPHEIDQIFDRLYRSQDEAVRNRPGGGIGLTMARTIIKRHGGNIRADSVYGQGSTFLITLPLVDTR